MTDRQVPMGRLLGPLGVRGWVKIQSYARPPEALAGYRPWRLHGAAGETECRLAEWRRHGELLAARFEGVGTREAAEALGKGEITVPRSALPPLPQGEHYWTDLEGLEVFGREGRRLGLLDHIIDAPANPVMVVVGDREHWVPLVPAYVQRVDLAGRRIDVDWDADF